MRSLCLLPLSHPLPLPLLSATSLSLSPFHLSLLPSLSPSISTPPLNFQSHSSAEDIPPFSLFPPLPSFPIIHAETLAHIPSLPPYSPSPPSTHLLFSGHPTPTPFKMIPRYPCQAHPVVLLSFLPPLSVSSQCHCTLNLISPPPPPYVTMMCVGEGSAGRKTDMHWCTVNEQTLIVVLLVSSVKRGEEIRQ